MAEQRGTCSVCRRSIWFAAAYGKWVHRKPANAYKSGPGFSGGQHQATPMSHTEEQADIINRTGA